MSVNNIIFSEKIPRIIFIIIVTLVLIFLIIPIVIIIPMSFTSGRYLEFPPVNFSIRWYQVFFSNQEWMISFGVSIQVALLTTFFSLIIGIPAAFAIVRTNIPFKGFFMAVFALPIVFPIIVSAVSLYYLFAPLQLVGTKIGLSISHTLLALPVVILPTVASLKRFDKNIEWQAQNLGASRIQVLSSITLPLLRPTLITAILFSFIISFDEIIFAIFLSGGSTITLPKKIWESLRFEIEPTVAAVATIIIIFSIAIMSAALVTRQNFGFRTRG
ncbi:MAG: polyamine ABC transporter permease [Candidatus Nitrosocosmicus sp.]|nr:polyamine ABC transporter permease [Candidatus Nitrosocosmicus sp.]